METYGLLSNQVEVDVMINLTAAYSTEQDSDSVVGLIRYCQICLPPSLYIHSLRCVM